MHDIDTIKNIFVADIGEGVCSVNQFENVENNSVYKIETKSQFYIFKIYKNGNWPENDKLLLVDQLLTEHGIPHAKIFVFNRGNPIFPNGYLIEECLQGTTADRLILSKAENTSIFEKLGALVSQLHQIKMTGYGYTKSGIADWVTYSEFMYDSMGDNKANLLAHGITDDEELERFGQELWKRMKICDKYPAVLCHTDLSTKNIIFNNGDITLIDWDDVYSLPWVHDIAELTFWLKREYEKEEAETYRNAFLENYKSEYDMNVFYEIEPVLHARIGLGSLNYFYAAPQASKIKQMLKSSLEKCEMGLLKCLMS